MICLDNIGYEASLERGKSYYLIKDLETEKNGLIRVIDESGESYCYPMSFFSSGDSFLSEIESCFKT